MGRVDHRQNQRDDPADGQKALPHPVAEVLDLTITLVFEVGVTVTPAGDLDELEEGCLSVPGIWTKIRRYKKATVTATDLEGREFTEQAEGIYARCLQHENDHLDGMTVVNRMGAAAKIAHRRQLKKLMEKQEGK